MKTKRKESDEIFEIILIENFSKLTPPNNRQAPKKKSTLRHIMFKPHKINNEEN